MTIDIYIPKSALPLSDETAKQQIRLGIQGAGGSGKNWSILGTPDGKQKGFPNCMVLNLDRGLASHIGCAGIYQIPFYKMSKLENRKDDLTIWFNNEAPRLTENQTLVIDSLSDMETIYHSWWDKFGKPASITQDGNFNKFEEWNIKDKWFSEIHSIIKNLRCDVITLTHETEKADKPTSPGQPGLYTGKIRPLLTGKFGDKLVKEYTMWFRQFSARKNLEPKDETLRDFRMTKSEFIECQKMFTGETFYYWQTCGDDNFDAKASGLQNIPTKIPATYETFLKYTKQQITPATK